MEHYDYIVAGAGAAGLSLLVHMMQYQQFHHKKILLVDKAPKINNDRTWCFWEVDEGIFEPVVYHTWKHLNFYSKQFSSLLDFAPYTYKMIRGIDFYQYAFKLLRPFTNIIVRYGNVGNINNTKSGAEVSVDGETVSARYVFNSIMFDKPVKSKKTYVLLQHFKGWMIETDSAKFDPGIGTLMDFRISQEHGTTFVYVLPIADNKALVEYTLFTGKLLDDAEYDHALSQYMQKLLGIERYTITDTEFGIIPMTNHRFRQNDGNIINIGTAGGQTKASSGYTFRFIQKNSKAITEALLKAGTPFVKQHFSKTRFRHYDSILLNILHHNKLPGEKIFADLFSKNSPERVLRFLDNESSLAEELSIMRSLPASVFAKAAINQFWG